MWLKVGNNRLPGEGDGETGGHGSSYNTIPRAVFVLSAALLVILPGEFLNRSLLSFTDHHAAEALCLANSSARPSVVTRFISSARGFIGD